VLFLVDACQSVGQMPVDAARIGCDFLSAAGRKFLRGPRGTGFLFVSDRALALALEPLLPDMRGAEWIGPDAYRPAGSALRFEYWETPVALVLGLGEAVRYALGVGLETVGNRVGALAERLRDRLTAIPGVRVLDRWRRRCAIVTQTVEGIRADAVVRELAERRIRGSVSWRGYAVLDFDEKGVEAAVRLSPHYYNTEEEIDAASDALAQIAVRPPSA
jgi:selenocysteine lyase/cysteine desulfurase